MNVMGYTFSEGTHLSKLMRLGKSPQNSKHRLTSVLEKKAKSAYIKKRVLTVGHGGERAAQGMRHLFLPAVSPSNLACSWNQGCAASASPRFKKPDVVTATAPATDKGENLTQNYQAGRELVRSEPEETFWYVPWSGNSPYPNIPGCTKENLSFSVAELK